MNFNQEESRAIVWSLVSIVMADGKVAPQEQNLLMKIISERLHQTLQILVQARTLTQSNVIPVLKNLSKEQKDFIVGLWDELMMVDGNIDSREVRTIVAMGKAIGANVSSYNYLLGMPISSLESLCGTKWQSTDGSININFDANSINGCMYNDAFGIYSYDRQNDLIQITVDDCGLSRNISITITSQYGDMMGVSISGKSYDLKRY